MLRTVTAVLLVQLALSLSAQEKTKEMEFRGQNAQRVAAWLRVSKDHAADYRLTFAEKPDVPLKLLPKAVFRHSQPVRGDDIGAVYLWVDEDALPAALGTVFAYSYQGGSGERWVAHEFHSLASTPLTGKRCGRLVARRARTGLEGSTRGTGGSRERQRPAAPDAGGRPADGRPQHRR